MTELRVENLYWQGARLGEENPQPLFREKQVDRQVPALESVPPEKRQYLGYQAGWRALPYRMQDRYTRKREPLSFRSLVLENDFLKATFLPELGGRLTSLIYKPQQRELLFNNPVFQPANLALRNAWFAGGIEWNVGQFGHCFSTCAPIFAAAIQGWHGEPGLRLYDYERCRNLLWQIDFFLPPDSPFLIASTRVVNPSDLATSLYWWTNIAVPQAPDVRVLAPARHALYIDFDFPESEYGFGQADMPHLPTLQGKDSTYPLNSTFANEFFFQCDAADMPWEAALDKNGTGFIEASTQKLYVRKLFCWGTHQGGWRWQEYLSRPGLAYVELQAGLAPTQLHSLPMPGRSQSRWTQVFGYIEADPSKVHGRDWTAAWQTVDVALKNKLPVQELARIEQQCQRQADVPSRDILHQGSGWGALEMVRRAREGSLANVPPAFVFPEATLGCEQRKWLHLLDKGKLEEQNPAEIPGEWLVQPEWREMLAKSLESEHNRNGYALLHYGVMLAEAFDDEAATAAWQESIQKWPSAWAYRNLGALSATLNKTDDALGYYEQAWELANSSGQPDVSFAQEYLALVYAAGDYGKAWTFYASLPARLQEHDPIQILRAKIALKLNDLDTVDEVLKREFASIKEGEVNLTDLWFEMWEKRLSAETGRPVDTALRQEVEQAYPPPASIDFRVRE